MISRRKSVDIAVNEHDLWLYMMEFENWAPYVIGFQKLVKVDEAKSVWTLRGDVGILAREVEIQVEKTHQTELERVEFSLEGLTERISGTGAFEIGPVTADGDIRPNDPADGGHSRTRQVRGVRRLFSDRKTVRKPVPAEQSVLNDRADSSGSDLSRLTFEISVTPGGPMAPMVELLMAPILDPAAEKICQQIRADMEDLDEN